MQEIVKESKGRLMLAILLGLLTFVVTGVIALIIAIPFFFLSKISENFSLVVIIGEIFRLEGLGGYFIAVFIMIATFALLGDLVTAKISWFITRSRKLTKITFISALVFQIIVTTFIFTDTFKKDQEAINIRMEQSKIYQQYVTIGDVNVEVLEPFKFKHVFDGKWIETLLFKKLIFTIPVTITHAGIYEFYIKYDIGSSRYHANSNSPTSIKQNLDVGDHLIKMEFVAGESPNFGYELPKSIHSKALIELDYLVSKRELINSLKLDENFDNGINLDSTVNQFIGRKEVQF